MSGTWLVLIVWPFRRLSVKEKKAGNFNLRHSPERWPLLILITRRACSQANTDHVREVRLYVTVGFLDISVQYILKQWIAFFARSDWLLNQ